jgi:endonuclease/exonuclease/phosphatase family metal-dependent hydrolase
MDVADAAAMNEPENEPEAPRARIMTWNVRSGGWSRREAIEAVIRAARPDIAGLQEIAPRTIDALAERLGMERVYSTPTSWHGSSVGLLSRWPVRVVPPHTDAPLLNAMLEAVIEPPGAAPLRVFVAHLAAAYNAWRAGESVRLRELRHILDGMAQAQEKGGEPQLLMGDFNSLAPDEPLLASRLLLGAAENDAARAKGASDLEGLPGLAKVLPPPLRSLGSALVALARWSPAATLLDAAAGAYTPRAVVAQTRAAGLIDLYAAALPDPRMRQLTCPANDPAGRIDYLFASPALAQGLLTCAIVVDSQACPVIAASDHRPVLATLALPPHRLP